MFPTDQPVALAAHGGPARGRLSIPTSGRSRLTRWACAAGTAAVTLAGLGFVAAVDPNSSTSPYPTCLLKSLTGLDCPGCGGTRAMHSLLHGDLAGAADHNVIVFLVAPVMAYMLVAYALSQFDVHLPIPRLRPWMSWIVILGLIGFSVVRNIPVSPFTYLRSELA